MASSIQSSEAHPLVNSFRDMLNDHLPESSSGAMVAIHSSGLVHTAYNIIRNLHYTALAEHFGVNDIAHFLAARVAFLEAALISIATTVHNIFFAAVYTVLVVGTLGIFQTFVRHCNHHWVNSYYSFLSTGTSLVGVVTPYWGARLSLNLFVSISNSILQDYKNDISPKEGQFLAKIKKIFNENYNFVRNWVQGHSEDTFEIEMGPSLAWLHKKINEVKCIHNKSNEASICLADVIDIFRKNYNDVNALEQAIKNLQSTREKSLNQNEVAAPPVDPPNFYPLVTDVRAMLKEELPESSSGALAVLQSSALVHTAYNIIRNSHYTFFAKDFGVNDFAHFLSSRIAFIEGVLISAVATVHNLFFAIIYAALSIATFGHSDTIIRHRNHHWQNSYYSLLSTGVSLLSVLTTYYGSGLSVLLFINIFNSILRDYKKEKAVNDTQIYTRIKVIFNKHYQIIYDWSKGYYKTTFEKQEKPALEWLKTMINEAKTTHYEEGEPEDICGVDIADIFVRHFPNIDALEKAMNDLKSARKTNPG